MIGRLPPAGFPLRSGDRRAALAGWRDPEGARERLVRSLEEIFPGRRAFPVSSGRAALTLLLDACRRVRPGRDRVAVGAYTCWSVPAAVSRAGLKVQPVDLDPADLDFREEALRGIDGDRILAIVTHHLFGHPNRLVRLEALAREWGAFLIDDAAQGFGAAPPGKTAGAAGEGGLLSFGRGKAIPALGGGALLVEKGGTLDGALRVPAGGGRGALRTCEAWAQSLFFRPSLYGIPASLPWLGIGETIYDESFAVGPAEGAVAGLAERLLHGREEKTEARRRRSERYREEAAARGLPIRFPEPAGPSSAIRCPVYVEAAERDAVWRAVRSLGVAASYPSPIREIPGLDPERLVSGGGTEGAETIAREILTLPTHPLIDDGIADSILEKMGRALR
ncbi:MAG: DegT/DnrJ/EryC1/StrS family aminotransferase [Candidatus Eisenbacteria bacterium]|nr:DegT/DnrJ/EryC1/StrS family aminotransferase [Candidatus Eisenbacteria bacterium]